MFKGKVYIIFDFNYLILTKNYELPKSIKNIGTF